MIKVECDAPGGQTAVSDKTNVLVNALTDRVKKNLSSNISEAESDAIAAAIVASFEAHDSSSFISISSSGVEVAAIQELGGKLAALDRAIGAKALASSGSGVDEYLRGEQQFGSAMPMRSRRASFLAERRGAIASGFKQAILEALGQG